MTKYDDAWVAAAGGRRSRGWTRDGLYRAEDEHDACGVGLRRGDRRQAAARGGRERHPGAAARSGTAARWTPTARPATAPASTCRSRWRSSTSRCAAPATSPRGEQLAVGQIFLPRNDFGAQEAARTIVEAEVLRMGHYIYGWRHVPVDISVPRREGQRDAARDRADPDLATPRASTRRPSSASST